MDETKVEDRAEEGGAKPVRLSYRTPQAPGSGAPPLATVVSHGVVFGFLAIAMFGLATLIICMWMDGSAKGGWFLLMLFCVAFIGLGLWLVYRMWWYVRSVGPRR